MERQFTKHADPELESIVADIYERTIDVRLLGAKGSLIATKGNKQPVELAIGTNDQVLTADSTATGGVSWKNVSALAVDHGTLAGLLDDDHTQYALNTHTFITVGAEARFANERTLAVSGLLTLVDGGAGGAITVGLLNSAINHAALSNLSFASAGHTDFLSTNTAQTITAQKLIDSSTALRFGHAAGATLSHAASGTELELTGSLDASEGFKVANSTFVIALTAGNPLIQFDTNDFLLYSVSTDVIVLRVGNVQILSASNTTFNIWTGAVINQSGEDSDTVIKGLADNNLTYWDASTDRVGIGTATPGVKLDVVGTGRFSDTVTFANGTLSLPSISFTNDQDTGLYSFDSNKLGITTGGVATVSIVSNSALGLAVINGLDLQLSLRSLRSATTGAGLSVYILGGTGVGTDQNGGHAILRTGVPTGTGVAGEIRIENTAGSVLARILNSGQMGIGASPATSAILELASTTGALLFPRMTTVQRDALTAVNGMQIYNSTTNTMQGYIAGAWTNM